MIEITKHIGEGFANGELYDVLKQLQEGMLPISGETYFVSIHGNNTDGLSWETAYNTIAAAITASNAFTVLTKNSGRRNRIYIDGKEEWEEDLVVLPNKCDMIGVGNTYGKRPRLRAVQNIGTLVRACRMYNFIFENDTAGVLFTLEGSSSQVEFHNCIFDMVGGIQTTVALKCEGSCKDLRVIGCRFQSSSNLSTARAIQLCGDCQFGEIKDNFISAKTVGIEIANAVGTHDYQLLIKDNVICRSDESNEQLVTGIAILSEDAKSHAYIVHNWISAATAVAYTSAASYAVHRDHWLCIDNHVVQANIADSLTDESSAGV